MMMGETSEKGGTLGARIMKGGRPSKQGNYVESCSQMCGRVGSACGRGDSRILQPAPRVPVTSAGTHRIPAHAAHAVRHYPSPPAHASYAPYTTYYMHTRHEKAAVPRNRPNRITNKTRLKVLVGQYDVEPIVLDEDEEKARGLSTAGVDAEDANVRELLESRVPSAG